MTNATITENATQSAPLRLGRTQLIGTSGAEGDRRALLRLPGGDTLLLKVGDATSEGTVTAIGPTALYLGDAARTRVYQMPGG